MKVRLISGWICKYNAGFTLHAQVERIKQRRSGAYAEQEQRAPVVLSYWQHIGSMHNWCFVAHSWTTACVAIQTSIFISVVFSSVLLRTLCAMCFEVWYDQHTLWCDVPLPSVPHTYVKHILYIASLHDKLEPTFQNVYTKKCQTLSGKIMSDPSHILYEEYEILPSNRRLRVAYARLNWLCYVMLSFVYQSVKLINHKWRFK